MLMIVPVSCCAVDEGGCGRDRFTSPIVSLLVVSTLKMVGSGVVVGRIMALHHLPSENRPETKRTMLQIIVARGYERVFSKSIFCYACAIRKSFNDIITATDYFRLVVV
jgi:hypothetical protein